MTINNEKTSILGCRVDLVDMEAALRTIEQAINDEQPSQVVTLNAEMIYYAQKDEALRELYSQARLVTADGIGVVWALRYTGHKMGGRVTGIDLTMELLKKAAIKGWRVYLLGSRPGVVDVLTEVLQLQQPNLKIAGTHHGYFEELQSPAIINLIKSAAPDILLVAMGAPKQDFWVYKHMKELMVPVCIGVGGTFDVLSGQAQRAPVVWQRLGLEWLYRLAKEPYRWRRQLALPKFVIKVITDGRNPGKQSIN